jgi:hypothetical protein
MARIEFVVPIAEVKYDSERELYVITLRARRLGKTGHETDVEITPAEFDQLGKVNSGDHVKITVERY